jgi:hypothetical protein
MCCFEVTKDSRRRHRTKSLLRRCDSIVISNQAFGLQTSQATPVAELLDATNRRNDSNMAGGITTELILASKQSWTLLPSDFGFQILPRLRSRAGLDNPKQVSSVFKSDERQPYARILTKYVSRLIGASVRLMQGSDLTCCLTPLEF